MNYFLKGLMDMNDENSVMDILPQPPPAHLNNGAASSSSILMSPLSEPRLTPTSAQTSYLHHQHRHQRPQPLLPLSSTWPGSYSFNLLTTAARKRSSSEEEEEPLSPRETLGHSGIFAISAASAIAASRAVSHRRRDIPMSNYRYL